IVTEHSSSNGRGAAVAKAGNAGILMKKQGGAASGFDHGKRSVDLPAPPSDTPSTVLAVIEKIALDPCADLEKLERMMTMYERLKAKEAEFADNAAKGRILRKVAEIKIVKNRLALHEIENGKPQKRTHEAFKYAPLEEIDRHLRPLLAAENMDLSYSDEPQPGGEIHVGPTGYDRWQVECAGRGEHQFLSAPLYRLQHLQHRGRRG